MHKKEKDKLREIVRKAKNKKEINKQMKEEIRELNNEERLQLLQELEVEYEIGMPIDRLYDILPLCFSSISLMISGLAFGDGGSIQNGLAVVWTLCIALSVLIVISSCLTILSCRQKKKLKRLINYINSLGKGC